MSKQRCSKNGVELSSELEFQEVCPLKVGYFRSWSFKMVSASIYDTWPLTGVCRVLVEKSPGPQFGVRLREVSAREARL